MASIKDIAFQVGLSKTAISNYLKNPATSRIREATKQRIRTIIDEFNFRPNVIAQSVFTNKTNVVGIVIPYDGMICENTFLDEFLSGIQRRLFQDDYSWLLPSSRGEDPITRIRLQIRKGQGYDGFVLFGTRYCTGEDMKLYVNELRTTSIPFVVANMPDLGLPLNQVVLRDPPNAGAIKYLLDLGHRQIFLMAGRPGDAQRKGEIIQYKSVIINKGVEADKQLTVRDSTRAITSEL